MNTLRPETSLTHPTPAPISVVAFDFDGTITTKDTFALFLRFYAGNLLWALKILSLMPDFILYGVKAIDRNNVKRRVVRRFFTGANLADIQAKADKFSEMIIPKLIRPKAATELKAKLARGEHVYIVSASIEHYLIPWAAKFGINNVYATQLEVRESRLTGELEGENCWGTGKTDRIRAEMGQVPYEIIEAYGDSEGDKPLLYAAKASFWRPFRL